MDNALILARISIPEAMVSAWHEDFEGLLARGVAVARITFSREAGKCQIEKEVLEKILLSPPSEEPYQQNWELHFYMRFYFVRLKQD